LGDQIACSSPEFIASGEESVLIGGKPAARLGDFTGLPNDCPSTSRGVITSGLPTVLIGKPYYGNVLSEAVDTGVPFCDVGNAGIECLSSGSNEVNGVSLDTLGAVVPEPID
jgi:hypothetical protein